MAGHYPYNTGIWRNRETTLAREVPNWMLAVCEAGNRTSVRQDPPQPRRVPGVASPGASRSFIHNIR